MWEIRFSALRPTLSRCTQAVYRQNDNLSRSALWEPQNKNRDSKYKIDVHSLLCDSATAHHGELSVYRVLRVPQSETT